jgi:hypothetical protein
MSRCRQVTFPRFPEIWRAPGRKSLPKEEPRERERENRRTMDMNNMHDNKRESTVPGSGHEIKRRKTGRPTGLKVTSVPLTFNM